MSLTSPTNKVVYSGNNSTVTAYAVPFRFIDNADVEVVLIDVNGVETTLALTTDYALTGEGQPSGGTVITVVAYDNTNQIRIRRNPSLVQTYDLAEGQANIMETLEAAMDYLMMCIQAVDTGLDIPLEGKADVHVTTTSPTVDDDSSRNYTLGHFWVNTTAGLVFCLVDATVGAAVWKEYTTYVSNAEVNVAIAEDAAASRNSLGLGSAAVEDTTAFDPAGAATAAQAAAIAAAAIDATSKANAAQAAAEAASDPVGSAAAAAAASIPLTAIPTYATLTAANAALGAIGIPFFNTANARYETTTDIA